jgi:peptide/nickel transport system substrate-binding protein
LVDKVVLRDDLFWSDGRPITAHDVVFSFQTILDTRIPIPAVRSGTDQLKWVHAYDDKTLVYFHKEPLATNVWALNFPVIPKHVYEQSIDEDVKLTDSDYHARLEENPICGGAYRVSKRVRGQEIVLERRDDYYQVGGRQVRPKPYFKTIRFRIIEDVNTAMLALKKGDVDDLELTPEQWTTLTNDDGYYQRNTKAKGLEWVYFYFAWNTRGNPFFGDVRVRQAMSYAFDHQEMLDKLCYGMFEPASGIWHPTSWMSPKKPAPPYRRDLDKAEALLAEAGWEDTDNDGILDREVDGRRVPFEFSVVVSQNPMRIAICDLLKQNLDEIGIVCNVRPLESTVLQEQMFNKRFQAAFGGWGTGADPDTADNIWATGEGRNYVSYSNPEVDRLFKAGKREFDRDKRGAIYAQIHELIYADQPYTWLYFQSSFYGFNKELRGYNFSPRGPYHYGPGFGSVYRAADR